MSGRKFGQHPLTRASPSGVHSSWELGAALHMGTEPMGQKSCDTCCIGGNHIASGSVPAIDGRLPRGGRHGSVTVSSSSLSCIFCNQSRGNVRRLLSLLPSPHPRTLPRPAANFEDTVRLRRRFPLSLAHLRTCLATPVNSVRGPFCCRWTGMGCFSGLALFNWWGLTSGTQGEVVMLPVFFHEALPLGVSRFVNLEIALVGPRVGLNIPASAKG